MLRFFLIVNLLILSTAPLCGQPGTVEYQNLFPIYEDGKVGYIDITGKKVIEPRLDAEGNFNQLSFPPARFFHEGVAVAASCSGKDQCTEGFIDQTGTFVIPPVYEQALQFSEGLAAVRSAGLWGFINHSGVMIIAPQFVEADLFENGLAVVRLRGRGRDLITPTGKLLKMPRGVQDFSKPSENMIAVKIGGKWGFLDRHGKLVIKPRFDPDLNDYSDDDYLGEFINGLAIVKLNDKWGYLNRQGKLVIPAKFHGAMPFEHSETGIVGLSYDDWRLIDRQGKFVSRRKFGDILPFGEGLAGALINDRWGFIDRTGKLVIPATFDQVRSFSEGLAAVQINGKWGFIDHAGKFVIEPRFETDSYFDHGLAKQITKRDYSDRTPFEWGYLDRTGKFVWKSQ
jgi:hypothetical protein